MSRLTLLGAILIIVFQSCKKDESENIYFEAQINGVLVDYPISNAQIKYFVTQSSSDSAVSIAIIGSQSDLRRAFTISFSFKALDTVSMPFSMETQNKYGLQAVFKDDSLNFSTALNSNNQVNSIFAINEISEHFVKGRFSFKATCLSRPDSTIIIENGRFCSKRKNQ